MMGDQLYHLKGYGEWLVIQAVRQRWDQRQALARTVAQRYHPEAWT
jgi:hypothetical protein